MAYLILSDFKKLIQTDNLSAIIGNDYSVLDQVQSAAQTEVISYLIQKYDVSREFTDTVPFSRATTYKANNRIYLDAAAYSSATVYAANALCLWSGNVYISIAGNAAHAFNASEWTLIGTQYQIFYVSLPYPEFNYETIYKVGDQVWWKDKTYTCKAATVVLSHETQLQYGNTANLPQGNVAPDDSISGFKNWGTGTAYSVTAGTLPTDTAKWTSGDNRNPQLVNYCIDIALYTVHSRIAPRNIPDLRVKRYDDAIKWLKNAAQGQTITANLPLIQPKSGARIRWGSDIKKINQY